MSTDDFFAEASSLIKPEPPVFIEGKFTDRGKWMDGWESRRRRTEGHDYCTVRICRGALKRLIVDTSHFTGNYPEVASVEACDSHGPPDDSTQWHEIVEKTQLKGDSHNTFEIASRQIWNHLRLHIYPDGGVARLRAYGTVFKDWTAIARDESVDLAAAENGGVAVACSDMHFGSAQNLLAPDRAANMGDGWETRRRRGPGYDWAALRLGHPGRVQGIHIDTLHFKGNYPARCAVMGVMAPDANAEELVRDKSLWKCLLPETRMQSDFLHRYGDEVRDIGPVSHVVLEMHPDGGVGRLRIFGTLS